MNLVNSGRWDWLRVATRAAEYEYQLLQMQALSGEPFARWMRVVDDAMAANAVTAPTRPERPLSRSEVIHEMQIALAFGSCPIDGQEQGRLFGRWWS